MTTSPFCSLYLSNLSCGISSGADLGAAFCACDVVGVFVELCEAGCEGAGFWAGAAAAKIKTAPAPSNKTRLSKAFIKVSFQMDTHRYRLKLDRRTTLAGVPEKPQLAYMGCGGVQASCLIRYFDGEGAPAFGRVRPRPTISRCRLAHWSSFSYFGPPLE